jgi:hypothetical protein
MSNFSITKIELKLLDYIQYQIQQLKTIDIEIIEINKVLNLNLAKSSGG